MSDYFLQDLDDCYRRSVPDGARRIAWDGLSFCVPSNWELAVWKSLRRGAMRVEMEDEYSIRLESEWIRGRDRLKLEKIMKRYEKATKPLTVKSDERSEIKGLPKGWHATHFVFKETGTGEAGGELGVVRHDLVTTFYLCPESNIFCFFLLHFMPEDHERPADIIQLLASTFQDHGSSAEWPWQMFDIQFMLPSDFKLEKTTFDIGAKLMVFHRKRRRLFLWYMSCADMLVKDGSSPAEWACRYMNGSRVLKAPVFYPEGKTRVGWRRRKPFFLGHREEIARLCYKYDVGCRILSEENKLLMWAYHYRKESDLGFLPSGML